jgi:hypothetical protein
MVWIFLSIAFLPVIVAVMAAIWLTTQPAEFDVERTKEIAVSPQTVFDSLVDLRQWEFWSPWLMHDPDARHDYSQVEQQVGSWSLWDGERVGSGRITHLGMEAASRLDQQVEFFKPFSSKSRCGWRLEPSSDGRSTKVTWWMAGRMPFFMRWLTSKMDDFIGKDYELGLARLAMHLGDRSEPSAFDFPGSVVQPSTRYISLPFAGTIEELRAIMPKELQRLVEALKNSNQQSMGDPFTLFRKFNMEKNEVDCDVAMPVAEGQVIENFETRTLPSYAAIRTDFFGDYQYLTLGWHAAFSQLRYSHAKFAKRRPCVERYLTTPDECSGIDLKTEIDIPT